MLRISISCVALLLIGARMAHAQGTASDPNFRGGLQPTPVDVSTVGISCSEAIPDSALRRTVVYASVELPNPDNEKFRPALENFLQDVAFHVSPMLGHSADTLVRAEPAATWRGLGAPLLLTWRADGRLDWHVDRTRKDTAAAVLLGRAVKATILEDSVIASDSGSPRPDSVTFRFQLYWPFVTLDGRMTMPPVPHSALPIFTINIPAMQNVQPAPSMARAEYPSTARDKGFQGTVLLGFVVDSSGRVDEATMRDIPAGTAYSENLMLYYDLVRAAKQAVRQSTFHPARIGGCPVRQMVRVPFIFALTGARPSAAPPPER